jgi:hypothetical protein
MTHNSRLITDATAPPKPPRHKEVHKKTDFIVDRLKSKPYIPE